MEFNNTRYSLKLVFKLSTITFETNSLNKSDILKNDFTIF